MDMFLKVVGGIVVVFLILAGLSLLLSWPLMWCWNYVMPYMFSFKTLTWSQAWCLSFVSGVLLKSSTVSTK